MKGIIYKEITLSKKQMILSGSMFLMISIIFILMRLSMECGNLAAKEEVRGHLQDNIWIFRYLPPVVLAFLYNPSYTMYNDIESHFLKFCRTTSIKMQKLIGGKVITLLIIEALVYVINITYLVLLGAVGGDSTPLSSYMIMLEIILFLCSIHLLMLFFSMIAKSRKTFEAMLVTVVTLVAVAYTPFLMKMMEKYQGREDIDILDAMRFELAPVGKYVLPLCAIMLVAGLFICLFFGSRVLVTRKE